MDLKNKVALVTGGGTGLGAVIVEKLAREGMALAVHYGHSEAEARQTVTRARELGVRAEAFRAELNGAAMVQEIPRLIAQVAETFGRLDLVVNNAATTRAVPFPELDGVTFEDWDSVMNVNVKAPFFVAQAAVPVLRRSGGGQIINTTSISGIRARGGSSIAYSVSKAAAIHLTKCLATAVAPDVRVNSVAPGLMRTRWLANFDDAQIAAATAQAPLKRTSDLDDTANAFVMLAHNESMTGHVIVVDAGITL
ncbi:MAG TPA: SDR family oxidoreductase [Polyangiaceae bacterium]|nr:SDR family oxidoreductase [Polyangiaceae bacterium]